MLQEFMDMQVLRKVQQNTSKYKILIDSAFAAMKLSHKVPP